VVFMDAELFSDLVDGAHARAAGDFDVGHVGQN
jgi:hypothetical protein